MIPRTLESTVTIRIYFCDILAQATQHHYLIISDPIPDQLVVRPSCPPLDGLLLESNSCLPCLIVLKWDTQDNTIVMDNYFGQLILQRPTTETDLFWQV